MDRGRGPEATVDDVMMRWRVMMMASNGLNFEQHRHETRLFREEIGNIIESDIDNSDVIALLCSA